MATTNKLKGARSLKISNGLAIPDGSTFLFLSWNLPATTDLDQLSRTFISWLLPATCYLDLVKVVTRKEKQFLVVTISIKFLGTALPVVNKYEKAQPVRNHRLLSLTSQHLSKVQQYTMVLDNCSICMNYWTSHGNYQAGYMHLIRNQHIPEAHANPTPSGPSVSDLQNQVNNANNRANGLQNQLDAANSRNSSLQIQVNNANAQVSSLQTQVNNSNTQVSSLQSQVAAANARANDLQKQLDDCSKAKKTSEDEVAKLKGDKVNLEKVNTKLVDEMKKKDMESQKHQADKLKADNRIQTKLEPYITMLINFMNANFLTGYPPRP